jgi:hypothetical protein
MNFPGEQLLIKMWDSLVEKGFGSLLRPWQIVRDGNAYNQVRRDELLMLEQTNFDVKEIRAGRKKFDYKSTLCLEANNDTNSSNILSLNQNFSDRYQGFSSFANSVLSISLADSIRKEINTSKAIVFAEEILSQDEQIPPERLIDDDWIHTWYEFAGKVSCEDLQRMWGSILAGEVKSPGKYAIRTLDFLRLLTKNEAECIAKIAPFVLADGIYCHQNQCMSDNGITFDLLLHIQSLGIVTGIGTHGMKKILQLNELSPAVSILCNNKALFVENDKKKNRIEIPMYPLTTIGIQIMSLGQFEANIDFMYFIGRQIKSQGFCVSIADWKNIDEDTNAFFNTVLIDN